jgi:hypothetical protein
MRGPFVIYRTLQFSIATPPLHPCRYSVFRVISVDIPTRITGDNPIAIHLEAAVDNANEDEELPLAPWH